MAAGLTPKQKRFVEEYLCDLNATAAYRRAGYAAKTDNAAAASASALLRNPKIAAAVAAGQASRAARTEITQDYVLDRLKKEAEREGEGSSHSARISALKLLGDHVRLFDARTPLEELLAALPAELAGRLRQALGGHLPAS